jgi:hypothetical protein
MCRVEVRRFAGADRHALIKAGRVAGGVSLSAVAVAPDCNELLKVLHQSSFY